ncbi:MAG: bifunctional DNA primase/polymerase [Planctomycetota bacterium]|jgi:hypothetical protein
MNTVEVRQKAIVQGYQLGWSYMPLNGKVPVLEGWTKASRETLEQALEWGRQGNVGIRTGANSGGLVVVDIEAEAEISGLDFPETVTVRTGSGGKHLYYYYTGHLGNSVSKLAPKVDIRADGGQVVAVGGIHPDTGLLYEYLIAPNGNPLTPLPQWIVDKLSAKPDSSDSSHKVIQLPDNRNGSNVLSRELKKVASAPEGQRNDQLNKSAFSLGQHIGAGQLDRTEVENALVSATSLSEKEARTTIKSGIEAGIKEPLQEIADTSSRPNISKLITDIALREAELCHDEDTNAYATIENKGHFETWAIRSKQFRLWLRKRLREEHGKSAYADALKSAIEEIESEALFNGPKEKVFVRLAENNGTIWLDLADESWRTVEVMSSGWIVHCEKPPVRFIRSKGMSALPIPERGGSIDDLRLFLNAKDESNFVLIVAWLLASLRPRGPYPVLCFYGEQGSAKSSAARILRALIDPNTASLRSEPREVRDLVISASNSWILSFDNLSHISVWLSDAFCRLSTGGGFAVRTLYENREEEIFDAQRPLILNGIEEMATRSDLLDRTISITLSTIPEEARKDEKSLWCSFNETCPKILGALLDAVAAGLANEHKVQLARKPRMADFAIWITACESGLGWPSGTFMNAYTENKASANETAIEASIIGPVLLSFMRDEAYWQGTASDLLEELEITAGEKTIKRKGWPKAANRLSGKLRRIAPNLRAIGIDIQFIQTSDKSRKRMIYITKTENIPKTSSESSEPTEDGVNTGGSTGNQMDDLDDEDGQCPTDRPIHNLPSVNGQQSQPDDVDGSDSILLSVSEKLPVDWTPEMREMYEERAAILECDGGLSREEAEKRAFEDALNAKADEMGSPDFVE